MVSPPGAQQRSGGRHGLAGQLVLVHVDHRSRSTTGRPWTSSSSSGGGRRAPGRRPGRRCRRGATVSTRQSARSASLPGSSEPISAVPAEHRGTAERRQLERRRGPSAPAARPGARANSTACRSSSSRLAGLVGGRAVDPEADGDAGVAAGRGSGRSRRRAGRWTTGSAPRRCRWRRVVRSRRRRRGGRRARTRRRRRASRGTRRTRPASSRTARGRTRPRRGSRRGGCAAGRPSPGQRGRLRSRSPVTENGEHGATADAQHRVRRRVVPAVDRRPRSRRRIASMSSTTWSGGSPPSTLPEVHRAAGREEPQAHRAGGLDLGGQQVAAVGGKT